MIIMKHQLKSIFTRAILVIAALAVICLSGCVDEEQSENAKVIKGSSEVKSPDPVQTAIEQTNVSSDPSDLRLIQGHVPHLVDATIGEHEFTNRLIDQTSPYLLQHAHNPVNWYSWGPEAFEAARCEDKPIFMSIGYSTCYWCHVMERESFENEEVAAYMNEHFIAIKVDREERPNVDAIYMAAIQSIAGRGGWPMSVFLEPQTLKPFSGGTFFRKPQFLGLMRQISNQWNGQRSQILLKADEIGNNVIRRLGSLTLPQKIQGSDVKDAVTRFQFSFDQTNGGFRRGAPKFPLPTNLQMLIYAAWDDPSMRQAMLFTLDRMAMGGIYDQIGGGFHRYSTDAKWLVPHFEKMLYDNGQLSSVYAEAYKRTGDSFYAKVLRETLDFVLREMTSPQGRLYSAQDAESEEREGGSYVWTQNQVRDVLYEAGLGADTDFALTVFGLDRGTNFQDPHHREDGRKNVLYLSNIPEVTAQSLGMSLPDFEQRLGKIKRAMLKARNLRIQPITDDKTLVAWNGLMIAGLADGGRVLNDPRYLKAANNAVQFIINNMLTEDGGLLRTYRSGEASIDGLLEDYAFFIRGLIALYRATGDDKLVQYADDLAQAARSRFWDQAYGGYYDSLAGQADLFVRTKTTRDGVVPNGNSVMIHNLLDLYKLTDKPQYLSDASDTLRFLSRMIKTQPTGSSIAVLALKRFAESYPDDLPGQSKRTAVPAEPVTITTSTNKLSVTPSQPGELQITLKIADGYHVNANDPGVSQLVGLTVQLIGKGYEAEVIYPQGDPYKGPLGDDELRVHSDEVTLQVKIKQTGTARTKPRIMVVYQVCTDKVCLAPARKVLPIDITASIIRR